MKPTLFYFLIAGTLLGCSRAPLPPVAEVTPPGEGVVATIGDEVILAADLQAEIDRRSRGRGAAYSLPEEREAVLREMINSEVVLLQAKAAGFDQKPEVVRQIEQLIVKEFLQANFSPDNEAQAVTEREIESWYKNHIQNFETPEQVRFAVIEFRISPKSTDQKKAEVLSRAEQVLAEARSLPEREHGFGYLAQKYSEDQATRYTRGDAGWIAKNRASRWAEPVIQAAFTLRHPGDLSPVVTTSEGCYLVKVIDRKEAGWRPLEGVKEAIRFQLAQEKRERSQGQFFDSMKVGLKIEINPAALKSVVTPTVQTETKPPRIPAA